MRDPYPKQLYAVITFGVASTLVQYLETNLKRAKQKAQKIKESGGRPFIYRCVRT